MEYFNNILCVSFAELTQGENPVLTRANYEKMANRKRINVPRPGKGKGSYALIEWASIGSEIQHKFIAKHGDPRLMVTKNNGFKALITSDAAADNWYRAYTLANGNHLKPKYIAMYTRNVEVLNAIDYVINASTAKRRALGITGTIWENVAETVWSLKSEIGHGLPKSSSRLRKKLKEFGGQNYELSNYEIFVSDKFGNKNTSKVKGVEQEASLRKLLSDHRNLDNEQIRNLYNFVAENLDWKKITASTVKNKRKLWDLETYAGAHGETAFDNAKAMLVKRKAPVLPMYYWTMDGWDVELFYQAQKQTNTGYLTTYTNRLTVVIVLDPCCKYPIGYAIGDHETVDLNKMALRNAINHTRELFGCRYKPLQLQTDNYGRGALKPFYEAATLQYTPARVKNSKSKIVEPYNKHLNKNYCQFMPNWSGFGVTVDKRKQPNADFLNKIRHSFPDKAGCTAQIEFMIGKERENKLEKYMAAYGELSEDKKYVFADEDYLLTLGETTGYTNRLSAMGLKVTIDKQEMCYDSFDPNFRELANVDWVIKYDPSDLSQVLVVNAKKDKMGISEIAEKRFLLNEKYVQPMALEDRKEGDAKQLQMVKNYNSDLKGSIVEKMKKDQKVIDQLFENNPQLNDSLSKFVICDSKGQHKDRKSENRLGLGSQLIAKQTCRNARKIEKKLVAAWEDEQNEYINNKVNIDEYL